MQHPFPSTTTRSLLSPWWDWVVMVTVSVLDVYISLSPCLWRTRTWLSLGNSVKRDSALKTQCFQCLRSIFLCVLPHRRRRPLWYKVNLGHLAGSLGWYPEVRSLFAMLQTDNLLCNQRVISTPRGRAEIKLLFLTIRINCLSSWVVVRLIHHPLMWLTSISVVSQNFADTSLQHAQHLCHFSLRIGLSLHFYKMHQYLL